MITDPSAFGFAQSDLMSVRRSSHEAVQLDGGVYISWMTQYCS